MARIPIRASVLACLVGLSALAGSPGARAIVPVYRQPHMVVSNKITAKVFPFPLSDVRLLDGPFKHAQEMDASYLLSLEPDRLLSRFRSNAGLKPKAEAYGGWEAQGIAGHTLGHYLSACSLMYASTGDKRFKERVDYIVRELSEVQKANGNGFVGAMPDGRKVFAEVAAGDIRSQGFDLNGNWVPWYNEHKTFAGLIDAYLYCGNAQAKDMLVKLAGWAYETTKNLTDAQWQTMLACEHGGMNDSLADVYALTGNRKYLELSEKFYHKAILDPLSKREDPLTGKHANTQIPKIIGTARLYELTGEDRFHTISGFFWDVVTKERSWVTGGNSDAEHFPPIDKMSENIGPNSQETCNTYNMLKLTRHLFTWEPKAEYADYYERALYNHILASQDPETGMMCYYVPLKTGSRKDYSTPFDSFWCCVGTGMENHAKYGDSIYFHGADSLYVNLFIPSELRWKERGITVRQETKFPNEGASRLSFTCEKPEKLTLCIRHPYWAERGFQVRVNGEPVDVSSRPGSYATLERTWKSGDTVEVVMPETLRAEPMRDNPRKVALMYGPLVLAARVDAAGPYPAAVGTTQEMLAGLHQSRENPLDFTATSAVFRTAGAERKAPIALEPFNAVHGAPTEVYWDVFTGAQWEKQKADYQAEQERLKKLEAATVDFFQPGEMQPERDHAFQGEKTETGEFQGRKWRHATDGGWFSFTVAVDPEHSQDLVCTYWGGDGGGRAFDVLIDGTELASQVLENNRPGVFFDETYPIPEALTRGKSRVTVTFRAQPGKMAGGLYGCRVTRR